MPDTLVSIELARVLDGLTDDQRREVLDFARAITPANGERRGAPSHSRPVGTPGRDLLRFAGSISPEDAAEMLRIIEEGCGQVDPDDWK